MNFSLCLLPFAFCLLPSGVWVYPELVPVQKQALGLPSE